MTKTKTTKEGFADAGQVIGRAMRALHPDAITYVDVQLELAAACKQDGAAAAASYRKVQAMLAAIAASDFYDPPRHRAINQSLRALTRVNAPVAPLATRTANRGAVK